MLTKSLFILGLLLLALSIVGTILFLNSSTAVEARRELVAPMAGVVLTPPGVFPSPNASPSASTLTPMPELSATSTPLPPLATSVAQSAATPTAPYPPPPQALFPQQGWAILGTHIVRPGESLYCIGRAYGVDPKAISTMNGLSFDQVLLSGTILRVPNVTWTRIPLGPVCLAQFSVSLALPTPTPQPTKPAATLPAATHTATPSPGPSPALPESAPPPPPLALLRVEAELPTTMRANQSDVVRLSLIRGVPVIVAPTSEGIDHQTVVAPIATPIGTPGVPPEQSFGPKYRTCAAAYLVAKAFEPTLTTLECQWLDRDELVWEWSVSSNQLGTQYLHFNVVMKWVPEPPATEIAQQIWHRSVRVEVEQPWIVAGQLTVLPIFGSLIGAFFTVPYLSERMKKRKDRSTS